MMMMKCQFHCWRKPEYLEETTDVRVQRAKGCVLVRVIVSRSNRGQTGHCAAVSQTLWRVPYYQICIYSPMCVARTDSAPS